jgi:hypothetical protein
MSTGTELVTVAQAFRDAQQRSTNDNATPDWNKWLIIAAAVFGALMLTRLLRRMSGMAFGLFWIWFWTHGAWRHVF